MDKESLAKEKLLKKIAGEIVLSDNHGKTIQKWRNIFKLSQKMLADEMHIMPSVISDYESGRRKSPGIKIIKRIVETLINIDEKHGGNIIKYFSSFPSETILSDAVISLKEFNKSISIEGFCRLINADIVVHKDLSKNNIYGYTIIDSLKAIINLPPIDLVKLYGLTTERALIFTNIKRGRSPMVAIKVANLKPGIVIFIGIKNIDEIAKRIGFVEKIPIAITSTTEKNIIELLYNRFD